MALLTLTPRIRKTEVTPPEIKSGSVAGRIVLSGRFRVLSDGIIHKLSIG